MTDTLTTHRLRELHRAALDRQMAANDAVAQREATDTAAAIAELLNARAYLATLAEQAKPVADPRPLIRAAKMLRNLGGMLPGVREIVLMVADEADELDAILAAQEKGP